jgi:hypothetical protein
LRRKRSDEAYRSESADENWDENRLRLMFDAGKNVIGLPWGVAVAQLRGSRQDKIEAELSSYF